MKKKKIFAAAAAFILILSLLSGCASEQLLAFPGQSKKDAGVTEAKPDEKTQNEENEPDSETEDKMPVPDELLIPDELPVPDELLTPENNVEDVSKLAKDAVKNSESIMSASLVDRIDMAGKINKMNGYEVGADFLLRSDIRGDFCGEDDPGHVNGFMSIAIASELINHEEKQDIDAYIVKEDGEKVCYLYDSETGRYARDDYDFDPKEDINSGVELIDMVAKGTLHGELRSSTKTIGGKEAYVIDVTLPFDYIEELRKSLSIEGTEEGSYYKDIKAAIYIYKDDHYPAGIEIDGKAIGDEMFRQVSGMSELQLDVETETCTITRYYENINNVEKIRIPDGVIEGASTWNPQAVQPQQQQPQTIVSSADTAYLRLENISATIRKPLIYGKIENLSDSFVSGSGANIEDMISGSYYINTWSASPDEHIREELATEWMADYPGYKNILAGPVNMMAVNGMTVYYAKLTYDYDTISCCEYCSCVQGEGGMIVAKIENSVSAGGQFVINDDTIRGIWSNITID